MEPKRAWIQEFVRIKIGWEGTLLTCGASSCCGDEDVPSSLLRLLGAGDGVSSTITSKMLDIVGRTPAPNNQIVEKASKRTSKEDPPPTVFFV